LLYAIQINRRAIEKSCPQSLHIAELVQHLEPLFQEYEINTPQRIAAFVFQIIHETCGLIDFVEKGGKDYCSKLYDLGTRRDG
jgi:predicted chitinase